MIKITEVNGPEKSPPERVDMGARDLVWDEKISPDDVLTTVIANGIWVLRVNASRYSAIDCC